MSTYVLTGQLLIFYNLRIDKTIFISLVFVILGITSFRNLIPSLTYSSYGSYLSEDVNIIDNKIEEGKDLFIVAQYDNGQIRTILSYYFCPTNVLGGSIGSPKYEEDSYTVDLTLEEFQQQILNTGYLYVLFQDDEAYEKYLLPSLNVYYIPDKSLYKIEGSLYNIKATKID